MYPNLSKYNRFNTSLIRNGAQKFAAASQELKVKEMRMEKIAASLTQGVDGWTGEGADAYKELSSKLCEDTKIAGEAFTGIASELNGLASQLDVVNQLREQADRLEEEITHLQRQLNRIDDPSREASIRSEISHLRYRHNSLEMEANTRERQADMRAKARFDEIGAMTSRLHLAEGVPEHLRVKEENPWALSWQDVLKVGVVAGLVFSRSIQFRPSPSNPNVYLISTANWLRGKSRFAWWNRLVKGYNSFKSKNPNPAKRTTVAKWLKDYSGISPNLTRINIKNLPLHIIRRAAVPAAVVGTALEEVKPLIDSWTKNSKNTQTREEFWRNFSQDAASSINKIVWRTVGMIGGTAAGAAGGAFVGGPAGGIFFGVVGGVAGDKAGGWVARKLDKWVRKGGAAVGEGIAKALNEYDRIKASISSFDKGLKLSTH